jgi:replicative DNA helicase
MPSSVPFQDALVSLLAERKLLRQLCSDLTRFQLMAMREQAQETEQRISDLVQEPLHLSQRESVTPWQLVSAVESLLSSEPIG